MAKPRPHRTPASEANKMVKTYLLIRDYVYNKIKDDESPQAELAKEYFSCGIQSFTFYKKELDKYFDDLEKTIQLNPELPEQFGVRIYPAAISESGRPSLVITLCKIVGTDSYCENVSLPALARDVIQHPRLASSASADVEGGDMQELLPEN